MMTCNGKAMSKVIGWGMIEISGRCYIKNGEVFVVDFACAKSRRIGILHNLTDIRRKASAGFGLRMDRVPVAYHCSLYVIVVDSKSHRICVLLLLSLQTLPHLLHFILRPL
jgi:hypothetical protein